MMSDSLLDTIEHDSDRGLDIGQHYFRNGDKDCEGDVWGILEISRGRSPVDSTDTYARHSPQVSLHRLKAMHSENIAWLMSHGYEGFKRGRIANIVGLLGDFFSQTNHLTYGTSGPPRKEIGLFSEVPNVNGAVYMEAREKTISDPLFTQNADLEFRALLLDETKELCEALGTDFNIYTYAALGNSGLKAETYVRFTLPFDQRSAQTTDHLLERKLTLVMPSFQRFMQLSYVH